MVPRSSSVFGVLPDYYNAAFVLNVYVPSNCFTAVFEVTNEDVTILIHEDASALRASRS